MTGPLHVCKNCGLVYIRERRTSEEVAADWTGLYRTAYSAISPQVRAQHAYLAEHLSNLVRLPSRRILDVGGGQGHFVEDLRRHGADAICLDPSPDNAFFSRVPGCHLHGRLEDLEGPVFDVITMNYTLENCADPMDILKRCYGLLILRGYILIQTGARILHPWDRPLGAYLSKRPPDTHPTRYSLNTLRGILENAGFIISDFVRWGDHIMVQGQKQEERVKETKLKDDWERVIKFFETWHTQSELLWGKKKDPRF